jgi:hypothetical protein
MTPRNPTMQPGRPVHMPPLAEAELEAQAIAEFERMGRALERKKSNDKPRHRRWSHADRG